ncbi:MAG: hypothetical protein PWR14_875 [Thermosediminibacterales bacterium]|jgi:hypothetical protein|nr:hypothetical protein [Thermosediminibacterales bacterium]
MDVEGKMINDRAYKVGFKGFRSFRKYSIKTLERILAMRMIIKKGLVCVFALALIVVLNFLVGTNTVNAMATDAVYKVGSDIQEQNVPDAFNPIKEKEKLKEYMTENTSSVRNEDFIKLSLNKPIILTFPDGSKIIYKLEIGNGAQNTSSFSIASSYRTYTVTKTYFVIIGNVNVSLSADCYHYNRYVTINRCYDKITGTFARINYHNIAIIDPTGYQGDYATAEAWGSFTYYLPGIGDYFTKSYRIQMDVDPAGDAYLRVLD